MILYQPREDSYLLAKYVKEHAFGKVLEIGTGSGIQAITAAKQKRVKSVLAVDIQKAVVEHCKNMIRSKKISFRQSDLFENVSGKFDTIIFNPPYLPEDIRIKDITVEGGKKGYETVEKFLDSANGHINPDGIILLLFSSLTKKDKVNSFIANNLLEFKELEMQSFFMEELYAYLIKKSDILVQLEKKRIKDIKKLTRGHRGIIFTGMLGKKKIAVKIQIKGTGAKGTVNRESKVLRLLNKYNIGPRILFSGNNFFVYEFVEGVFIPTLLEKASAKGIKIVLKRVFEQCNLLDRLKLKKEEMQNPYKHVIITKGNKPVLLDFERTRKTIKPHNVTQFCQYVTSGTVQHLVEGRIKIDKEKIRAMAKVYRYEPSIFNLNRILKEI
ncbi:MAG: methyltransferase [Candidatus Woesearchaeota archaeon]|nr:methyltransferase [Candidatus Woesearchaeota archaeon]